jgi:hypothetical protein
VPAWIAAFQTDGAIFVMCASGVVLMDRRPMMVLGVIVIRIRVDMQRGQLAGN